MLELASADFFQNKLLKKNSFRNTIRVSKDVDPYQDPCPDLDPNCFHLIMEANTMKLDQKRSSLILVHQAFSSKCVTGK